MFNKLFKIFYEYKSVKYVRLFIFEIYFTEKIIIYYIVKFSS